MNTQFPRLLRLILTVCILGIGLSACGGGGGNDNSNAQTSSDCVLGTAKIGECQIQ